MMDLAPLGRLLEASPLEDWGHALPPRVAAALAARPHGDWPRWREILDRLPPIAPSHAVLDQDRVAVDGEASEAERASVREGLLALHPWRKGPFRIHGVEIDAEWRADVKWRRVARAIAPLQGRRVLDVGCGNGYYAWRMLGEGARLVVGIDPSLLYLCQFEAVRHFLGEGHPAFVLPLALEDLPAGPEGFDTVFSMGVLYHRRSPLDHLLRLRECLRPGGELVLETLVIRGGPSEVLLPPNRYARMRNVWLIPTPQALVGWLQRCGFRKVRVADVTATTPAEQRSTPWMRFESLADALDPADPSLTLEGLPAPVRALVVADA